MLGCLIFCFHIFWLFLRTLLVVLVFLLWALLLLLLLLLLLPLLSWSAAGLVLLVLLRLFCSVAASATIADATADYGSPSLSPSPPPFHVLAFVVIASIIQSVEHGAR